MTALRFILGVALVACGGAGSSDGPDGGSSDPRAGFVGTWKPRSQHHWAYSCNDGTGGGYDRAQTGFYWSVDLGTENRIAISIHDPLYPTCVNGAGTCSHDYVVSGNTATRVADATGVTGTYVLSTDNMQLAEAIAYTDRSTGPTCQWTETDTLIHGMP
jgi:hypothetical protein